MSDSKCMSIMYVYLHVPEILSIQADTAILEREKMKPSQSIVIKLTWISWSAKVTPP